MPLDVADRATCKRCLAIYGVRRDDLRGVTWEEALRAILHVIAGPPVTPAPLLTREVWAQMQCRRGTLAEGVDDVSLDPLRITPRAWSDGGRREHAMRCRCPVCEAEAASLGASANWEAEQQIRPHRTYAHEFGSWEAALQMLARWRLDGPGSRSSAGTTIARLSESAKLGASVQTTQRYDRDDLPIRRAQQATDIERMLRRAFAESAERRGLTVDVCIAVVLSTVMPGRPSLAVLAERTGLTTRAVGAMLRHARKAFTIEAAVGGYIPMPRRETGLVAQIEARIAEGR